MVLEARNIHKNFGSLEVLKGVDFCADKAEVVAVTGSSGAGKTTLLQILGTLSTPSDGTLSINGQTVFENGKTRMKDLAAFRGREIGFVFQEHNLLPEFDALENVMLPALIAGKAKKESAEKAMSLLERIGLGNRTGHKPSELSGGEQQRVAIARALINSPSVLFADEPTGSLDSATKQEIHSLLLELRRDLGQTIIIVTHDPELAAVCDRSLFMRDGLFTF